MCTKSEVKHHSIMWQSVDPLHRVFQRSMDIIPKIGICTDLVIVNYSLMVLDTGTGT